MIDLKSPISELVKEVKNGGVTSVQLVQQSIDRIYATKDFNAVLELNEHALAEAKAIDLRISQGEDVGSLAGIPYIAKDNFLTKGTHTTAASNILKPFTAPYEGVAIRRLKNAGAIMVAKANMDAFAHGGSTENSDFGPTKNPFNQEFVPGGSSGGSAASIALGQACFALGTDTGGSIRQPASYCGVVGLKPTYGLVPRTGVVAMASSTDVIGPMTNSVSDSSIVLDVIAGMDSSDSTSIERDTMGYLETELDLRGIRVGIIEQYLADGVNSEIKDSVLATAAKLTERGAKVESVSLPSTQLALAAYYILVPAEISSNLARYDGIRYGYTSDSATDLESTYKLSRQEGFGAEAKRRIMIGTYVLSSGYYDAYYKRAQKVRTKLINEFEAAFEKYDILIGPTAPTTAFKLGLNSHDPLAMYLNDVTTVAVNLVGIGSISIPLGFSTAGMPYGLQIMAAQKNERVLLGAATKIEQVIGKI